MITFEQFKNVLASPTARNLQGLDFADRQVSFLLSDEGSAVVFFERWTEQGQPKLTLTLDRPATASTSIPRSPSFAPTETSRKEKPPRVQPASGLALAGFITSLSAYLLVGTGFAYILGVVGVCLAVGALVVGEANVFQWRRLAYAGVIVGPIALLVNVYQHIRSLM